MKLMVSFGEDSIHRLLDMLGETGCQIFGIGLVEL